MQPKALAQLARFFRYLATERRVSPHTVAAYRLDLAALVTHCDAESIATWVQLTPRHVQALITAGHKAGMAAASLQRRMSAIRSFLTWLGGEGAVRINAAESAQAPRLRRRLPAVLTPEQMAKLLEIPGNDLLAIRDQAIMELLYSSALRLAELVRLNCTDLDLTARMLIVQGKGNKTRIVPIGSHALLALRAWLRVRNSLTTRAEQALFVSKRGGRLNCRTVQVMIAERAKQQGITTRVHPHLFRHSCATHLLEASTVSSDGKLTGFGLREVQEFLGHQSPNTTAIYTHLDAKHLARVYHTAHPRPHMKPGRKTDD